MIEIILGNVGSGKTATKIREIAINDNQRKTYTNIQTQLPNVVEITPKMIFKTTINEKGKKTLEFNKEYWENIHEPINVVIDEAHTILNSRRSMTKVNIIVTEWLALIRRVLGQTPQGKGKLTFITQLWNRLDTIARDMATNITYCKMHYKKKCQKCGFSWQEHSELPEEQEKCYKCGSRELEQNNHSVEIYKFTNMENFLTWKEGKKKTYYDHYLIQDINKYFKHYNTLQWDNLFGNVYTS